MREKLMGWLESNSTITEKAPDAEGDQPKKAAAKKGTAKKAKADADAEPAAEA
jgi:trigger factor